MTDYTSPCCSSDLPYVPGADPSCPWCEGSGLDLEVWFDFRQSKACFWCCVDPLTGVPDYRAPAEFLEESRPLDSDKDGWLDDGRLAVETIRAKYMGEWLPPERVTSIGMHSGTTGGSIAHYFRDAPDGRVVSAHFEIRKSGEIRQMVPVGRGSRVAFHCGVRNRPHIPGDQSRANRARKANPGGGAAYGIEHQGPFGKPYSDEQIDATVRTVSALLELCPNLVAIEAHSRVYPRSRRDPGKLFPWRRFEGLGLDLLR